MQAKITVEGECVVVHLIGRLDVETAEPFRKACLEQLTDKKVIFSFRNLSFVGSSGILPFLETMQDFAKTNKKGLKFCSVGIEFRKILAATSLSTIDIFDDERLAANAFAAAASIPGVTASTVVPAPTNAPGEMSSTSTQAPPQMPPMRARAITEGINPIFNQDDEAVPMAMDAGILESDAADAAFDDDDL